MSETIRSYTEFDKWFETFKINCQNSGISRIGRFEDLEFHSTVFELFALKNGKVFKVSKTVSETMIEYINYPYELFRSKWEDCYFELVEALKGE